MSSISEQIAQDQMTSAKKAAGKLAKPIGKSTVKGICLIVKANKFTTKAGERQIPMLQNVREAFE